MSNQPVKIDQKIVGYSVVKAGENAQEQAAAVQDTPANENSYQPTIMGEHVARPSVLTGTTYKIDKSPASEHAMYVTINDIILDQGTEHEERLPFEIFINSKNMEEFQWVVALTRIMSAVFRKGGDVTFMVEELKAVFDPKGGYWKPGTGIFVPSVVAEIGMVVEQHLERIGVLQKEGLTDAQKALIAEKRKQAEAATGGQEVTGGGNYPAGATQCAKCHQKAVVILDGCATCLECGNSKCG